MLATLLIWLSAAVAILALADLFLSEAQKGWLSNAVVKLWSILDEAKGWSFVDWLKKLRAIWWLAISVGFVVASLSETLIDFTIFAIIAPETPLEWATLSVTLLLGVPLSIILFCLFTILIARALAFVAGAILYVGEFMVRRIAEYPKGPVLALSTFFGGVCALIKAFG